MPSPTKIGGGKDKFFVGTDLLLEWEVVDKNGSPIDYTGDTLRFVMRTTINAADAVIDKAVTPVGAGLLQLLLSDTDTAIAPRTYHYSVKRLDDGQERIIAHGTVVVEKTTQV